MEEIDRFVSKVEAVAEAIANSPCHLGKKEDAFILARLAVETLDKIQPPISNEFVADGCEQFAEKCEAGCIDPVVGHDSEGIPLCQGCIDELRTRESV